MKEDLQGHILAVNDAIIAGGLQRDLLPPGREWKDGGKNWVTNCPFPDHEDRNPSFSISKMDPKFICTCGRSGNYLQLIAALEGLPYKPLFGEAFNTALARLERIAGVPPLEYSPQAQARQAQTRRRGDILTAAAEYFREGLKPDTGTWKYLEGRGYTKADIEAAGLGDFPGFQKTLDHLRGVGFEAAEIYTDPQDGGKPGGALPWLKAWPNHRLAIPFYNVTKTAVIGIKVRPTRDPKPGEGKYTPLSDMAEGFKKENLYNIDRARGKALILVEGLLDAAVLTARGIPAAALDGCELYPGQIAQALRYGAESFILALDNDQAGQVGTEKAILELFRLDPPRPVYVVRYPEGIKDADELLKAQGIEAFKAALEAKEPAGRWITARAINSLPANADPWAIFEALKGFWAAASPIDHGEALAELGQFYPQEGLKIQLEQFREKERAKQEQKDIDAKTWALWEKAQDVINEKGPAAALELMAQESQALAARRALADKSDNPFYSIPDYLEDEKHEPAGLRTGYDNLDKIITIPSGGLTIIAGRPGHGKTTLMLNLMLNQIDRPENQGKAFFFISYEQPKKQLMRRLVMMKSGHIIDEHQTDMNYQDFGRALKFGGDHAKINEALAALGGYIQAERLALIDHPYFVDELAGMLKKWAGRYQIGGVYVDYIQKVKARGGWKEGYLVLKAISEQFLESAKALKIPIILGAQVNRTAAESMEKLRLESLREAGDLEQDANLVLGLWNKARGTADDTGEPWERDRKTTLYIKVLKNRDGITTKPDKPESLVFDQPILKITDKTKTGTY